MALYPKRSPGQKAVWHDELIEYLANPLDKRTWDQFSAGIGLTAQSVLDYRKQFQDEIASDVEAVRKKYTSSLRSVAMKSLAKQLEKGDTNSLKLFFQLAGDLVEKHESKVEMLTPEEKQAKARAILEEAFKKMNASGLSQDEKSESRPE